MTAPTLPTWQLTSCSGCTHHNGLMLLTCNTHRLTLASSTFNVQDGLGSSATAAVILARQAIHMAEWLHQALRCQTECI